MKLFVAVIYSTIAFLALASVATGGNPSLCARDGWTSAQSSSGQSFTSIQDCAKAREVFQPTLVLTPTSLAPNEQIEIRGSGFHSFTNLTLTLAVTGEAPYWSENRIGSFADGSVQVWTEFDRCGAGSLQPHLHPHRLVRCPRVG